MLCITERCDAGLVRFGLNLESEIKFRYIYENLFQ